MQLSEFLSTSRILIIDDFAGFRQTIKSMLSRMQAKKIDQASNGIEALKYCSENQYQIIFCDYNLGDGPDGQQVLEELYHRSLLKRGTLFIMVTAETAEAQVIGALEYHPDHYLAKPFTGEQLELSLERLVKRMLALEPIHSCINKGELEQAIQKCDEVAASRPKYRLSCARIQSELFEVLKQTDSALAVYQSVVEEQPLFWAMMGIGKILFDQNDMEQARDHFLRILDHYPRQVSVLDWLAKCEARLGNLEAAENNLLRAIEISSKSMMRQYSLGKIASRLEHVDIAHKAFTRALQEGANSFMLQARHFQHFYANCCQMVESLSGLEKLRMMAEAGGQFNAMEKKFRKTPAKITSNMSLVASLFHKQGEIESAKTLLRKINAAMKTEDFQMTEHDVCLLEENLQELSNDAQYETILSSISKGITQQKEIIKNDPVLSIHFDEPLIETLPPVSMYTQSDQLLIAKRLSKQGLEMMNNDEPALALEKFREAIKLAPENPVFLLNAAHVILVNPSLCKLTKLVKEAKTYLESSATSDTGLLRKKHYQSLMSKLDSV